MGSFRLRNTRRAQQLRNAATPAERAPWKQLQGSKLGGHKFSRQIPIGPFFGDFVCRHHKLVVEIDGYSHDLTAEADARRTTYLEQSENRVVRFMNEDVLGNMEGLIAAIEAELVRSPTPGPFREREGRRF